MDEYDIEDFYLDKSFYRKLYRLTKLVNNILVENGIQYWTDGGTLIGVLRHRGMIPWDDDVDIKVWHKDWLRLLKPEMVDKFKKAGLTIVREKNRDRSIILIKVFPTNAKERKDNYGLPFIDIFSVSLDKEDPKRVVFSHKWARKLWGKGYQTIDEMYPLKYSKYSNFKIIVPNHAEEYLTRLYGKSWKKEGRIYQSHVLGIELEKPLIWNGPFLAAKDFDNTVELVQAPKKLLEKYPL